MFGRVFGCFGDFKQRGGEKNINDVNIRDAGDVTRSNGKLECYGDFSMLESSMIIDHHLQCSAFVYSGVSTTPTSRVDEDV